MTNLNGLNVIQTIGGNLIFNYCYGLDNLIGLNALKLLVDVWRFHIQSGKPYWN